MMQVESRISRRSEDVSSWVPANGEMASGVDTVEAGGEIALHVCLEIGNVGLVDD